jgi:tripartite-type tricarboxylate transporter receptor subunit TctC
VLALGSIRLAGVALVLACGAAPAAALEYPIRPITLVVPHKLGVPSDVIARVLGKLIGDVLRQPLVIENRPGAGGSIAAEQVAEAEPDGYTLLMGTTASLVINPARSGKAGSLPTSQFAPITLIGTHANVLVTHPSVPAFSLPELVVIARAKPGAMTFASSGHGSASHLAAELFKAEARVDLVHVPYKKPGPALQDVVGGHVKMMFAPAALVANHIRFGRLRGIAVATPARSAIMPWLATINELGLSGFDATTWYGLVAPAGTPKEIIDVLHHTTGAVLDDPTARRILGGLGIDVVGSTPKDFEAYIDSQIPKWAAVIRTLSTHTY